MFVAKCECQADIAAHRLPHDHRLLEFQSVAERNNEVRIELCRELVFVFFQIEIGRRERFAMPRQIKGDDAEVRRDIGIAELMPILPAVGARGVQANHWNALAALFVVGAVVLPSHCT